MSSSSSDQDEPAAQPEGKPEWLEPFLQRTYFGSCEIHGPPRNELNRYCIDCDSPACLHCIDAGTHAQHRVLKIYRHVYKDAVLQSDMENHIDCSMIQAYRSNRKLVIVLNPLPHSSSQTGGDTACANCTRKLMDPRANRYCSIACKVEVFNKKPNRSEPPFLALRIPSPPPSSSTSPSQSSSPAPSPPSSPSSDGGPNSKRPRKGVPHRAPLS
ncbi:hypothetical protein Vadar_010283 [Vaccinium darrowii]|uniref:Uncharacterized protein n=1 Tax=Vaccinium darrowii TaxID=229202 RepID=A0ACB7Y6L6_9ERIC|nr:hypothetical protein Vadar_010283 [Vaccinium darrowii]